MPAMAEQLADQRELLAAHHRVAGHGVVQVVEPQLAETGVVAGRAPARLEDPLAAALGMAREQKRAWVGLTGGESRCLSAASPSGTARGPV